jgi:hypothetical protein
VGLKCQLSTKVERSFSDFGFGIVKTVMLFPFPPELVSRSFGTKCLAWPSFLSSVSGAFNPRVASYSQ